MYIVPRAILRKIILKKNEKSAQGNFIRWGDSCLHAPLFNIIDDRLLYLLGNPLLTGHSSSVFEGLLQ